MSGPLRIPLSWPLNNRLNVADSVGGFSIDARRINVMDEPRTDGQPGVYTVKRPGLATLAFPPGVAQPGQGCYAMNGSAFSVFNDSLYVTTPTPSGTSMTAGTVTATPPWAARYGHKCVTLNDQIFLLGGNNGTGTYQNDVWVTSDGSNWRIASNAPPWGQRYGFGAAVLNGSIFVFGGYNGTTYYNDVWSSPDGVTWTLVTPAALWAGRFNMGVCAGNNGIYLFGGTVAGAPVNDLFYTSDGQIWVPVTTTGTVPPVRSSAALFWFHNKLYVVGGANAGAVGLNDVWSSPNGQVWTQETAAAFTVGTYGAGAVIYGDKMWIIGGSSNAGNRLQAIYSSATGTGAWTSVSTTMPTGVLGDVQSVVFRTPVAASAYRYPSIWTMGGFNLAVSNAVWYGVLDQTLTSFALAPTTTGQPYQFASFKSGTQMLVKNQSNMWVFSEGTVVKVADTGYPLVTVPGIVVLGGFAYVMDPTGLIRNCVLDDPFHWPSLNAIGADYEDDAGVCLAKLQNYVVAFGSYTTQFFRDAGLDTGSPLVPYLAANLKVGTAYASSVAEVGSTLAFLSQTRQLDRKVVVFDGLSPKPISTMYVEKYLQFNFTPIVGLCFGCEGHLFYALVTPGSTNTTLVYDFGVKQWYEWAAATGSALNLSGATSLLTPDSFIVQHATTGKLYTMSTNNLADAEGNFTVLLQTQKFDAGNNRMKFWGRLDVIGDQNVGTPSIQFTDDDYATFSAARTVDMSTTRPSLFRNGASRRRAYRYTQIDANPMRLEALEQEYAP